MGLRITLAEWDNVGRWSGCEMHKLRVLIVDFDFFTATGGGQVFYRRVVERNPDLKFLYPSRGPDILLKRSGQLPQNAEPFAYDAAANLVPFPLGTELHSSSHYFVQQLAAVAAAVQGCRFDVVDFPSFFPAASFARSILIASGVIAERVAISFLGWLSVSNRKAYLGEGSSDVISALELMERQSVDAADIRYAISSVELHQDWKTDLPVLQIDMHDALEMVPIPEEDPPGEGPPDLWYVGRLDGAKGPDIFIELVGRMPRHLYRRCLLAGPDNEWSASLRWSEHLLALANERGVEATYVRSLSDAELRERVFRGRTVAVIPSRTDSFNYVALETTLNGCPILLSARAGASVFLTEFHPDIAPPIIDPEDVEDAASKLEDLLRHYADRARSLRRRLRDAPFPTPRLGFMAPVYGAALVPAPAVRMGVATLTEKIGGNLPLMHPVNLSWRPLRRAVEPRVSIIIPTFDRPALLAPTLASLTRQTYGAFEAVVVDDGSPRADVVRDVVMSFAPMARLIRSGNGGEAAAVNRGIAEARGEFVGILSDDDFYHPELIEESVQSLEKHRHAVGTYPDWDIVDSSGYFVESHRLPDFDRRLMLRAHWCLPGVGAIARRSVLEAIGGRDITFRWVSDFDLWLRATAHGDLVHIPRRLAYWRLHQTNLTTSDRRQLMAEERVRLLDRLFADPTEKAAEADRVTAIAAAHLAAAAILGKAEAERAHYHLERAKRLDDELLRNLPPNMTTYPQVWPD